MSAELTDSQLRVLTHALTGGSRNKTVYRNRYAVGPTGYSYKDVQDLVKLGLMRETEHAIGLMVSVYEVTEAGAAAVELELPKED